MILHRLQRGSRSLAFAGAALLAAAALARQPEAALIAPPPPTEPGARTPVPVAIALDAHPDLRSGTFPSGTRWHALPHPSPARALTLRAHFDVGTLCESDDKLGASQLIPRLVKRRLADALPGAAIAAARDRLRIDPDRDFRALVGFTATTYTLTLPDADAARAADAAALLAAILDDDLVIDRAALERERRLATEQKRAEAGVIQRLNDALWPRLVPGSRLTDRLPDKANAAELWTLSEDQLRIFHQVWYTPAALSVIAVGDLAADDLAAALTPFQHRAPRARFPMPGHGVAPQRELAAMVAADPELTADVVELVTLQPSSGPITTDLAARARVVDRLALLALNRRFTDRIAAGAMAGQIAGVVSSDMPPLRSALVFARGGAGEWSPVLRDMVIEVQRAATLGFTQAELSSAAQQLLADADSAADAQDAEPHDRLIERLSDAIASASTIRSPRQEADVARAVLSAGVAPAEVTAALQDRLTPARAAYVVLSSGADPGVTEQAALDVVRDALGRSLTQIADAPPPAAILDQTPAPGTVARLSMHAADVTTAQLASGITLRHKPLDAGDNRVTVSVALVGGMAQETADTRGLTQAFAVLARHPAAVSRSSRDLRALLAGKDVRLSVQIAEPRVTLTVTASRADLESGMQLLHLLLTQPLLEPTQLDHWRTLVAQNAAMRAMQPASRALELMLGSLSPENDRRLLPLTADEARAIQPDAAQQWITRLCTAAPAEAAIVGDITLKDAVDLAARYLASLPARPAVTPLTPAREPCVHPDCGPLDRTIAITTPTREQAAVFVGFRGADCELCDDGRSLNLAAAILTTRLSALLRDQRQLVSGVAVTSRPVERFPGSGQFWAAAICDPARADELAAAVENAIADFAASGPAAAELADAAGRARQQADRALTDPAHWAAALSTLTQRARSVEDVLNEPAALAALTPDDLRAHVAAHATRDRKIRVIVRPE